MSWTLWVVTASSRRRMRRAVAEVEALGIGPVIGVVEPCRRGNLFGTVDAIAAAERRVGSLSGEAVVLLHDAGRATRSSSLLAGVSRGALPVGGIREGRRLSLLSAVARGIGPLAASARRGRVDVFWTSQLFDVDPACAANAPGGDLVKRFVPGVEDRLDDLGLARLVDGHVVDFRPRGSFARGEREAWLRTGPAWRDVGGVSMSLDLVRAIPDLLPGLAVADVDPTLTLRASAGQLGLSVGAHDLGAATRWLRLRRPDEWAAASRAVTAPDGGRWRDQLCLPVPIESSRLGRSTVRAGDVGWDEVAHGVTISGVLVRSAYVAQSALTNGSSVHGSWVVGAQGKLHALNARVCRSRGTVVVTDGVTLGP